MECFQYCKKKYKKKYRRNSDPIQTSPNSTNSSNTKNFTLDNSALSSKTSKSTGTSGTPSRSVSDLYEERAHNVRVFNLKELRDATRNFSRDLKIGEGGFGSVYKGFLKGINANKEDGILVAVKKLNPNSLQGHKQWLAEVQFLGIVDHPNLVKLIGYCSVDAERGAQRLLVYEFINNKTLDHHLFNKSYPSLSWNTRLNIALGAAEGLLYLHEGMEIQVIYRDFKASNILLDEEFKPKLSDFGLAREGPTFDKTHVSTAIMGTNGYAAPDYVETGHLTAKSDVWSFGVVLYELLTGRRSMDRNRPKNEIKLIEWVKYYPIETKRFEFIIDPRLEKLYNVIAAREIARLAESCLAKLARDRPSMSQVVQELRHAIQSGDLNEQVENLEDELGENVEEKRETTVLQSSERRMRHLAKLSENAGGVRTRGFLLMRERSLFT